MSVAYLSGTIGIFSSLYLSIHRASFQQDVIESSPAKAEKLFLSTLEFSKIKWIEKGLEFEWNDKLYDVSKIEKTKSGFQVYAVNDNVEEGFIVLVDQWKKNNAPIGKVKTIFHPQFCNHLVIVVTKKEKDMPPGFSFIIHFYTPPIDEAPAPPPKG